VLVQNPVSTHVALRQIERKKIDTARRHLMALCIPDRLAVRFH
jgi:hypothetical protein